jgi:uncharacterized membrane protein
LRLRVECLNVQSRTIVVIFATLTLSPCSIQGQTGLVAGVESRNN